MAADPSPTRARGACQTSLSSLIGIEPTVHADAVRAIAERRTNALHDAKVRNLHKATAPGAGKKIGGVTPASRVSLLRFGCGGNGTLGRKSSYTHTPSED